MEETMEDIMALVAVVAAKVQEEGEAKANSNIMDSPTFLLIA